MAKKEVRHIHVEPADRGALVTIHHKDTGGKNKGPWLSDSSETKKIATTPEEAGAHVTNALREHFGAGDSNVEGAKASKGGKSAAPKGDSHPKNDDGPEAEYA